MITLKFNALSPQEQVFVHHIGLPVSENGCILKKTLGEHLCVKRNGDTILIEYAKPCELYRGIALLKEGISQGEVKYQPATLDSLGAMFDCSRNAVPTVKMLKEYILDLAALGYHQLQLYTEDTFEIEGVPYFGHMRGRYTAEEIREVDAFAAQYGIELVPAVQTLAHLAAIFKWPSFEEIHDLDDILLCGDDKTYDFLDRMMAALRSMYTTDKIHIGMDEAHMMGLGKYLDRNGYHTQIEIFLKHIQKVAEIAHRYGFQPMMWSDMYFKTACQGNRLCESRGIKFDKDVLDKIPENMSLICWNYWVQPDGWYEDMMNSHISMQREVIFGGGFQKWTGFCPTMHHALRACRQGLNAVYRCGIRKALVAGWGDNGAEGSMYMLLPGLTLYAEKCYVGNMDDEALDFRLRVLFGRELQDFNLVEEIHNIPDCVENEEIPPRNLNKILLWNDPLLGLYDRHILPGTCAHLASLTQPLAKAASRGDRFDYLFETVAYLCRFLSIKSEIGVDLRQAYQAGDKQKLNGIRLSIPEMIQQLDAFHQVFRKNWLRENKIFGFEVQDIRFGALRARLVYTQEILERYVNGEIPEIPEMEAPCLYMDCRDGHAKKSLHYNALNWQEIASANPI